MVQSTNRISYRNDTAVFLDAYQDMRCRLGLVAGKPSLSHDDERYTETYIARGWDTVDCEVVRVLVGLSTDCYRRGGK